MSDVVNMPADPPGILHRSVRAATRTHHLAVDRLMARLDLGRREDYGFLLAVHHGVLQDLKPDWRPEDRDDFRAMSQKLQNDLSLLGFPTANLQSAYRAPLAQGDQLGIAYVIRGSRLGSSILRPRVAPQFSASYFDFAPALSWMQFLAQLQSASNDAKPGTGDAVIRGAKIVFEMYSRLLNRAL
jgi:heme oxygenase